LHSWRKESANLPSVDSLIGLKNDKIAWYNNWADHIKATLKAKPLIVGVFANNQIDEVNSIAKEVGLDIVQLSGNEGFAASNQISLPTWKAIHVGSESSSEIFDIIQTGPISVLLDTNDPKVSGGTGKAFDWIVGREVSLKLPIILAGGLNPTNIAQAIADVKPFAVDVSSGVETDGTKDITKIQQFITLVK